MDHGNKERTSTIILTRDDILRAKSYMPMAEKVRFAEKAAAGSRNVVRVGAKDADGKEFSLPAMRAENTERKMRYMMGALVKKYLCMDFDGAENDPDLPAWDDYDRFGESHLINQIERMKADKDVRDKCFDILQDYRTLEKMVNTELYSTMQVENDPVTRFLAYMQSSMSPENMQRMQREAENVRKELERYLKERDPSHEKG